MTCVPRLGLGLRGHDRQVIAAITNSRHGRKRLRRRPLMRPKTHTSTRMPISIMRLSGRCKCVVAGSALRAVRVERRLQRMERTGGDIAEHHTERAGDQGPRRCPGPFAIREAWQGCSRWQLSGRNRRQLEPSLIRSASNAVLPQSEKAQHPTFIAAASPDHRRRPQWPRRARARSTSEEDRTDARWQRRECRHRG